MLMATVCKGNEFLHVGLRAVYNRSNVAKLFCCANTLFLDCLWFSVYVIIVTATSVGFVPF